MNATVFSNKWRIGLIGFVAALSLPGAAMAQHAGAGFGGHGDGGGMHSSGGMNGSGMHDGGEFHGGGGGFHTAPGGFHGSGFHDPGFHGPGFHDGFHGRGFRFHDGFFRPRFFGGLALGAFVTTLPLFYDTYWWGGVPYYYYDDTYFLWNGDMQGYQVVTPPSDVAAAASQATDQQQGTDLFAYPMKGQSADQQKTDRYECHSWAVTQSGYDPTAGAATDASKSDAYQRADAACLEGRGYSVD